MKKFAFCIYLLILPGLLFAGGKSKKYFKEKHILKTMERVADWQLAHPKWKKYEWHNAPLYNGIFATFKTTSDEKYLKACEDMFEENNHKPGPRWYHADDIAIGQTYLEMYRQEKSESYIKALRDTIDKMFTVKPPFQSNRKDWRKCFWCWCDALYMAPPTLVKLGVFTGENKYLELSDKLYQETIDCLWDEKENLFARDLRYVWEDDTYKDKKAEKNGEKIFWSRGNGWVLGGLVMMLKDMPAEWPTRAKYEKLFIKMVKRVAELQPKDGLWRAGLLDPYSYPHGETSGSSFMVYAMAYGINNGLLDEATYMPVIEKAWSALNECVTKKGMLGYAQPVGAAPQRNFSQNDWEVYASGAFLLAASEVIKL